MYTISLKLLKNRHQADAGSKAILLNLSQSLQNALSDNRAGNIGAYKDNDCQNNNAPAGLGKGITAASLGRLLKARGYRVTMQKFDPYINIDPGTMNPIQHGEVFVTDDGAETDLDLGHYERFY